MYQNSSVLQDFLQNNIDCQVNSKRIKKQIQLLSKIEDDKLNLQLPIINGSSISFPLAYSCQKTYHFKLQLNKEYPFVKPQIRSLDGVAYYGQSRDLLSSYMNSINIQWNFSITLKRIIEMIPNIIVMIENNKDQLIGNYFVNQQYEQSQLIQNGFTIFDFKKSFKPLLLPRFIPGVDKNQKMQVNTNNQLILIGNNNKNQQTYCKQESFQGKIKQKIAISQYVLLAFNFNKHTSMLVLDNIYDLNDISILYKLQVMFKQCCNSGISNIQNFGRVFKMVLEKYQSITKELEKQSSQSSQNVKDKLLLRYNKLIVYYYDKNLTKHSQYLSKKKKLQKKK